MDDIRSSELSGVGLSFARLGSEATQHLSEQGQTFAKAVGEWNTEIGHFLSHRAAQNRDAIARMAKCENFGEAFSVQAKWLRDATDDYFRQFGKLLEVNSKFFGDALKPMAKATTEALERGSAATAKVPMKV